MQEVYYTTDNTAKAGSDYVAKTETLTFAPGETSKTATVNFIGDDTPELNETFFLDLKTPVNATIADGRGVGTLHNDDGPRLTIEDAVPVTEGDTNLVEQRFIVRLSAASTKTVTVDWATASDSATAADYVEAAGTLTFAPGQTSKLIVIKVKGDTLPESDEIYKVNLLRPTYSVISDAQAVGLIHDNDPVVDPKTAFADEPSQ